MATTLKNSYGDIVFSSALQELTFSTDLELLTVAIYPDSDYGDELYSTTLYTTSLQVSFYDVRTIIETYMAKMKLSFLPFLVECRDSSQSVVASVTLNVIYCTHILPVEPEIFAREHFLSTLSSKRTYPHSSEFLSVLHSQENCILYAQCVFASASGSTIMATVELNRCGWSYTSVHTFVISYDDIVNRLNALDYKVDKLLAYTISWDYRTFTFYVHDFNPDVIFTFRNCFNVLEIVALSAVTIAKTKVERGVAVARSLYSLYDQNTSKSYDVKSSSLSLDEARWIEQLFISSSVWLGAALDDSVLPAILITDSTCEISDDNAHLNSVQFTWQFAHKVPHLKVNFKADPDGIFTQPFNYAYN